MRLKIQGNRPLSGFAVLLITILALIVLAEIIFFFINRFNSTIIRSPRQFFIGNSITGYYNRPNERQNVIKEYVDGRVIYDVTYTTDEFGRRITEKGGQADSHIIFFGGSYTFGNGLNDTETLPYYLSSKASGKSIYNYASTGFGPNMVLAQLQSGNIADEVAEKKGVAIYVYMGNHVRRAIGAICVDDRTPYFYLDSNGSVIRDGSFATGQPLKRFVYNLIRLSNVYKSCHPPIPVRISDKDIFLTAKIINEAAKLYRAQFDGKFYVLLHPQSGRHSDKFLKFLNSYNIKIINLRNLLEGKEESQYYIKDDGHPSFLLNKLLAENIIKELKLQDGQ